MKQQLNEMFQKYSKIAEPANEYYIDHLYFCWKDVEYIGGGYSSTNVDIQYKSELSLPVNDKLYFAGEASCTKSTVLHSAGEAGVNAANLVFHSLFPQIVI